MADIEKLRSLLASVQELVISARGMGLPPIIASEPLGLFEEEIENTWETLPRADAIHRLRGAAKASQQTGETALEMRMIERLCVVAQADLDAKGSLATKREIRAAGMDFVTLSFLYKVEGRLADARAVSDKGRRILKDTGFDVDGILPPLE